MSQESLRAYLASPALVCPWGRAVRKVFVLESALNSAAVEAARSALLGGEAVVLLAEGPERDFEGARRWCTMRLGQLRLAFLGEEPREQEEEEEEAASYPAPAARPARAVAVLSPFLDWPGCSVYALGMGPQYPSAHPRYAPALCLALTNEEDVPSATASRSDARCGGARERRTIRTMCGSRSPSADVRSFRGGGTTSPARGASSRPACGYLRATLFALADRRTVPGALVRKSRRSE